MKLMSSTTEYVATKTQEAHNCTWTVVYDLKINTLALVLALVLQIVFTSLKFKTSKSVG